MPKNRVGDYTIKRELKQWVVVESMLDEHDAIQQCAEDLCSQEHQDLIFCSFYLNLGVQQVIYHVLYSLKYLLVTFISTLVTFISTFIMHCTSLCWKTPLSCAFPTMAEKAFRSK